MHPFAEPSGLPFGFPDFAAIRTADFRPAFADAMAAHRAEVDAITADPEPATFENTLVALERAGQMLDRVSAVFFTLVASCSDDEIRAIQAEVSPQLAAHEDAIALDPALFARVRTVHDAAPELKPESAHLLVRRYRDAVRAGALLSDPEKDRLRAINAELATLSTEFGQRLLADMNAAAVVVEDVARLDGLDAGSVSAVAQAATARGHDGAYLLALVLPTGQPALAQLTDRALREELMTASLGRGTGGGPNDTRDLVLRTARLRAQRARLLGHPHHAAYVVEDATAQDVEKLDAVLDRLVPPAVANADAERAALEAVAGHPIEAWDWAFYAERVRRERYALDADEVRPYLELERVLRDGVFHAAGALYGLTFTERTDLPVYHEDVRVFDVARDGAPLGLFVTDHYARASKRGGAWMNSFVGQSRLLDTRPVVLNTLNLAKPAPGEPTLLTLEEVRTLFHEFGHALHGLLSDVEYPSFAGTSVPRDVVEYPSQVNEMWLLWPEVLANYARHHLTGEPMPAELVERVRAGRRHGEGFATTEYLAATLLDQAWHRLAPDTEVTDVAAFEADALAAAGLAVPTVPPRYRSPYFQHVFAGGYSAGYYSYIWAEVLDADTVDWFTERGGLRRANGEAFRAGVLAKGGSTDAMDAYRAFRGRDPEIGPLLARRGL